MTQTKATGHAGNKRRSDSAVAQQLTPANTRKRAAKTKRLNLFCSIISKQNEVRKIIQIILPANIHIFLPPQFNKHLFEIKPVQNDLFKFYSTIRESKIACYFTKRTVPPAIFPPTDTPRHHFVTHLPSFIYKIRPLAATLLEQPLSTLSHPRTLSGKQQKVKVNSTILPLFSPHPKRRFSTLKRKTKIKAPDIENGHTATASRIILKNEEHVPHVSYIYRYLCRQKAETLTDYAQKNVTLPQLTFIHPQSIHTR